LTLGFEHDAGAASFDCVLRWVGYRGMFGVADGGEAGGDSADRGGLGGGEAGADFGEEEALGGVDLWTLMSF
jgi:hypothetical protein